MKISIFIGLRSSTPGLSGLIETSVRAETDGFDGAWLPQLFMEDVLTAISVIGERTNRIELGTAVVPSFTRHPWTMAQQALTAQVATGGRLALGIGPSHKVTIEGNFGLRFERIAEHIDEYVSIVRELVDTGSVDFTGQHYRVRGEMEVAGAGRFPILISALGPRMLDVAGRLADGTVTWMVGRNALERHIAPRIRTAAERSGRPAPRICVGVPIAVTDNRERATEEAGSRFAGYARLPSYRRMLDIEGADGPAEVAVVGSEAEVERQLRGYAESGATDILAMIFPVGSSEEASSERTWSLLRSLVGRI